MTVCRVSRRTHRWHDGGQGGGERRERLTGSLSMGEVERFMEQAAIPFRLAAHNNSGPVALSLWFIPMDGKLWCATHVSATDRVPGLRLPLRLRGCGRYASLQGRE